MQIRSLHATYHLQAAELVREDATVGMLHAERESKLRKTIEAYVTLQLRLVQFNISTGRTQMMCVILFHDVIFLFNKYLYLFCSPRVEAGKNTSTVIPASRKRRRKGNRISLR
jgi:hypothetical protein